MMAKRHLTEPAKPKLLVLDETTIDPSCLETFPYEHPGKEVVVEIDTDEFTAVCPWSGLPDFGRVTIRYAPRTRVLELRSFKFYLLTYRNVGIYQEHAARRLLDDLVRVTRPRWMELSLDYKIRGGVHTVCRATAGGGGARMHRGERGRSAR
ncbi:MAG: NADPH-dependent 7-cyano-7-deazaguanine reductase QueF [Deltaproteobacteria bacterium]|nr:NADPH-dependent 7-cyano-7-deazaguanine reductase QueF [Deltaproteobacteria bacterium]